MQPALEDCQELKRHHDPTKIQSCLSASESKPIFIRGIIPDFSWKPVSPVLQHHISSGRQWLNATAIYVKFSDYFHWHWREQLVAGKEADPSKYLPVPNFLNIWPAQLGPQRVSFAVQCTKRSRKPAAGQNRESRAVMSVFPKEATSFALTDLQLTNLQT